MKTSNNAIFKIHFHLVLLTKNRKKVIDEPVKERLFEIFTELCERWGCDLQEFNSEQDHVHLLLDGRPEVKPSVLINNLKTVSSRYIRKESPELREKSGAFWSSSYCLVSCGDAPLEIVKAYIENQGAKGKDND